MDCPFIIKKYGPHYYIAQTRPISTDDFAPIVSSSSLNYITDDAWEQGSVPEVYHSEPRFSKTFTLKCIWVEKVREQITNDPDLKNYIYTTGRGDSLKAFMEFLNISAQSALSHTFDWTGCRGDNSRIKKITKNKQIFEERLSQNKEKEEHRTYNSALVKVIRAINKVNESISYELKGSIANNIFQHTNDDMVKIPDFMIMEKEIQEIETILAPLKEKLRKLRDEQHSLRCNVLIEKVIKQDIPYDIKQPILDELVKKKVSGYPRMPHFS
jgi:uncharacterized FlaG/YvyC family protein